MHDVIVELSDLPHSVRGLCAQNSDGDYVVVLNARMNHEMIKETYHHELRHILLGHLHQIEKSLAQIEGEAG